MPSLPRRFAVRDPAVAWLGHIVHDADLRDDRYDEAETAGVALDVLERELIGMKVGEQKKVQGTSYVRPCVRVNAILKFDELSLVVAYASRGLLRREVTVDDERIVRVERGFRQLVNLELGRSFGPLKVALTYMLGSEPPAFMRADALTILKALF